MKRVASALPVLVAVASCVVSLAVGTLLLLLILESANEGAQAQGGSGTDPQIIGIDVVPDANNTATTLGIIDKCVSVTHPATFDIDTFLDDVPTGKDLSSFEYDLNYDAAYLKVSTCKNSGSYLLGSTAGSSIGNVGDSCPDSDGAL